MQYKEASKNLLFKMRICIGFKDKKPKTCSLKQTVAQRNCNALHLKCQCFIKCLHCRFLIVEFFLFFFLCQAVGQYEEHRSQTTHHKHENFLFYNRLIPVSLWIKFPLASVGIFPGKVNEKHKLVSRRP